MVKQNDESKEALVFQDREESSALLDAALSGSPHARTEGLARLLISLRIALHEETRTRLESDTTLKTELELDRLIELIFQQSTAYGYALEMYERRFEINGGGDPARLFEDFVKRHLAVDDAKPIPGETESSTSQQAASEPVRSSQGSVPVKPDRKLAAIIAVSNVDDEATLDKILAVATGRGVG